MQNYSKKPEGLRTNNMVVRTDSALSLLQSNSSPPQWLLTAPQVWVQRAPVPEQGAFTITAGDQASHLN